MEVKIIDRVFAQFEKFLTLLPNEVDLIGTTLQIPRFSPEIIQYVFTQAESSLMVNGVMPKVNGDVYVVGDIHGNFHDLIRILVSIDNPLEQKYVFLGDYVDRGNFSIEVIMFLLTFHLKYQDQVILLRGNHEFRSTNSIYGFHTEVINTYGDEAVFDAANNCFNFLPISAIINEELLCVHGGIGPNVETIDDIMNIPYPIDKYEEKGTLSDLLWSDPGTEAPYYIESSRGLGCIFGIVALCQFNKKNGIKHLIRAHQCVKHGISKFSNGACITVFSTSNYTNKGNSAGYLFITKENEIQPFFLEPHQYIKREGAIFNDIFVPTTNQQGRRASLCMSISIITPVHVLPRRAIKVNSAIATPPVFVTTRSSKCSTPISLKQKACNKSQLFLPFPSMKPKESIIASP